MWKSLLLVTAIGGVATAGPLPKGYEVLPGSISPDGTLVVIAPIADPKLDEQAHLNQVIVVGTNQSLGVIDAPVYYLNQNHAEAHYVWSRDSHQLLWSIGGKWGSAALLVIEVKGGAIASQVNVRELAVAHVLAEVKKAKPKVAKAAAIEGKGSGWWFRDGFAIDVAPKDAALAMYDPANHEESMFASLPLPITIAITSNPKALDTFPKRAELWAEETATVSTTGAITFAKLRFTTRP